MLTEEDYLCSVLFTLFNPIIDSMRGLCACSDFQQVQEEVCSRHVSLGSFSEAQQVFGSQRVSQVFAELVEEDRRLRHPDDSKRFPDLLLVDSSVFPAVARMVWAQWRSQNTEQSAVRLHLKFHVFGGHPADASVTGARRCERKALEEMMSPGEFYVGDRNYGRDYQMLKRLGEAECGYIFRMANNANMTVIEELPLDDEDGAAGVVSDQRVQLGARKCWHHGPVRVIRIEKPDLREPLILVTNQTDHTVFSAALIAQIYWQRWKIELFFRWLKCVLGRPQKWHWLAESAQGVSIQLYAALIAALLLSRRLGKLPDKRTMELLRFHALGMVSDAHLEKVLEKLLAKKSV